MHGEVLVSIHLKSDMHRCSRRTRTGEEYSSTRSSFLLLLLLTSSPSKKSSLHNFGDMTLYDLMCYIRLGASSISKSKSLMVSSANTLAHHILHHLHLIYKKRLFALGCDYLILHSQSNAEVNLSKGGQSLDKTSQLFHLD